MYNGGWHHIKGGKIPAVILVRDGAVIPKVKLAQSTKDIDWKNIELVVFNSGKTQSTGYVCLPSDNILREISVNQKNGKYVLEADPLKGVVNWNIHGYKQ